MGSFARDLMVPSFPPISGVGVHRPYSIIEWRSYVISHLSVYLTAPFRCP